jgi:hypothetical protein
MNAAVLVGLDLLIALGMASGIVPRVLRQEGGPGADRPAAKHPKLTTGMATADAAVDGSHLSASGLSGGAAAGLDVDSVPEPPGVAVEARTASGVADRAQLPQTAQGAQEQPTGEPSEPHDEATEVRLSGQQNQPAGGEPSPLAGEPQGQEQPQKQDQQQVEVDQQNQPAEGEPSPLAGEPQGQEQPQEQDQPPSQSEQEQATDESYETETEAEDQPSPLDRDASSDSDGQQQSDKLRQLLPAELNPFIAALLAPDRLPKHRVFSVTRYSFDNDARMYLHRRRLLQGGRKAQLTPHAIPPPAPALSRLVISPCGGGDAVRPAQNVPQGEIDGTRQRHARQPEPGVPLEQAQEPAGWRLD